MAAGTAAAGMCLVLALLALMAARGDTTVSNVAASHGMARGDRGHRTPGRRPPHLPGQPGHQVADPTLATYRGTGSAKPHRFTVDKPGDWGLSWSFGCPAGHGIFSISERHSGSGKEIKVNASGPSGHGISFQTKDPGDHSIAVTSDCSWKVRVFLRGHR